MPKGPALLLATLSLILVGLSGCIDTDAARSQGYEEGYTDGLEAGSAGAASETDAAYQDGYDEGYSDGYSDGTTDTDEAYKQSSGNGPAPSDQAVDCDYQGSHGDGYGPVLEEYGLSTKKVGYGNQVRMWIVAHDCNAVTDYEARFYHMDTNLDARADIEWDCQNEDGGGQPNCSDGNHTLVWDVPAGFAKGWYELHQVYLADALDNGSLYWSQEGQIAKLRFEIV